MGYIDSQRTKLGEGDRYAVKVQNRDDNTSGETHWINATPDQVKRILEILSEDDRVYVLTTDDVGKTMIRAFGRTWPVVDFMGTVQRGDVGKHVTRVDANAGDGSILTVENNEQRDRRVQQSQR